MTACTTVPNNTLVNLLVSVKREPHHSSVTQSGVTHCHRATFCRKAATCESVASGNVFVCPVSVNTLTLGMLGFQKAKQKVRGAVYWCVCSLLCSLVLAFFAATTNLATDLATKSQKLRCSELCNCSNFDTTWQLQTKLPTLTSQKPSKQNKSKQNPTLSSYEMLSKLCQASKTAGIKALVTWACCAPYAGGIHALAGAAIGTCVASKHVDPQKPCWRNFGVCLKHIWVNALVGGAAGVLAPITLPAVFFCSYVPRGETNGRHTIFVKC